MNTFLAGVFVSRLGDSFSFLAFILILTNKGASNGLISLFIIAHYLPGVLIGLWCHEWLDRVPKKKCLIATYTASSALTFLAIYNASSPFRLLLISLLLGVAYGIYTPLQKAFIAEVFPSKKLKSVNSMFQLTEALAKTFGFALAGLTFRSMGATTSFILDAASFLAIALALTRTNTLPIIQESKARPLARLNDPRFTMSSIIFALTWLSTGALFALEASYARTYLNASETTIGWLFAFATLGSLTVPYWINRLGDRSDLQTIIFACLFENVFVAGYAGSSAMFPAIACIIGYGFSLTTRSVLLASWIHREIPRANHGSAFGLQQSLSNLAMMLGMGLSGPISELVGVRTVILFGTALSFLGIVALSLRFYFRHRPVAIC